MIGNDPLLNQIRALPKIELHRHLEGSLRLETLVAIALEYNITLPRFDADGLRPYVQIMPQDPRDWQHFLGKFYTLRQFYRSPDIIKRVTYEVVTDAAADNVKYMELRFTPQALNNLISCSYEDVTAWVCQAAAEASSKHGIQVRLILSMNRHESVGIGELVLEAALAHIQAGVVGLDLAGQESEYSARPFETLFQRAKEAGLGITVHAGEWSGADSVRDAVEYLQADRIGHGIRSIEDSTLVENLIQRGTVLEVCPTSNLQSGVVDKLNEHPLSSLFRQGVRTTINTDDPLISDITLSDEITRTMHEMAFTLDDIKQQTITAAEAAFLPPTERDLLVAQFKTWLAS